MGKSVTGYPARPYLILGHPRSGTTAISQMLNASSQLACIYYESNLLVHLCKMLNRKEVLNEPIGDLEVDFGTAARFNLHERSKRTACRKIAFPIHAVDKLTEVFRRCIESHSDIREIFSLVSRAFFQVAAEHSRLEIVGDKVPDYTYIPDVVCAPHPDIRIISIYREPHAVAHSALELNRRTLHLFATPNSFAMAFSIALREMEMQDFYRKFPKEQVISIGQPDLCNAPLKVVENIFSFLGISIVDDDILRFVRDNGKGTYRLKDWKREMTSANREAVGAVFSAFGMTDTCGDRSRCTSYSALFEMAKRLKGVVKMAQNQVPQSIEEIRSGFKKENYQDVIGASLIKIGDFFHIKGQLEKAKLFFECALEMLPENGILWFKYGVLCYDMKLLDVAQKALLKVEEHCPEDSYYRLLRTKAIYLLGRIERLSGCFEKAMAHYRRALTLFPDFRLAQGMLAICDSQ